MKKVLILGIAACLTLFVFSCSKNDTTSPPQGYFMVANISPDSKPLNVYVNGTGLVTGLSYGNYTPYFSASGGSYTFLFTDSLNNTVLSNVATIAANTTYDYYLIDSFKKVIPTFIKNSYTAPSADSVLIRFFNFSPNSTPLSLADAATTLKLYTQRYFNDQAGDTTKSVFMKMPKGVYTFQLKNLFDSTVASRLDTLVGGHVYSLFAKGFYGGTGTQSLGIGRVQNY
jgi:hypothetical protein